MASRLHLKKLISKQGGRYEETTFINRSALLVYFRWVKRRERSHACRGQSQLRIEVGQRRRRWRNRGYATGNRIGYGRTFTRDVQRGWRVYRETYQVRYLPNGTTQTMLISRVRIR